MTKQQKSKYQPSADLLAVLKAMNGKKFRLDCGHHITLGSNLGNNLVILNGKEPRVICSLCHN